MRTPILRRLVIPLLITALVPAALAQSTPPADCSCVIKLPELRTNACQAFVPDLCTLATNCFSPFVIIGSPGYCSQSPGPGTPVGPGTTYISLTVTDSQGLSTQCVVPFTVTPAPACTFTLICASNKTVECGTTWSFNPPTWTNACAPPPGTVSNGVVLTVLSTVTNGSCPMVITRTWQGVDDCQNHDQCSQTVTVADTIPPQLNCACISNNAALPPLTIVACSGTIPDLCIPARACAQDACGVVSCSQTPAAGTPVGLGVHPITVTVSDCASNSDSCVIYYSVIAPAGGCQSNCVQPPSGLVGWWPLDEPCGATLLADISGNGNSALVESGGPVCSGGSPNLVAGKVAAAKYFYGLLVRGRALNAPSLNVGQSSFSLDCWVKPVQVGTTQWQPILDKLQVTGTGTGFGYAAGLRNAKVVLRVGDGTLYSYTSISSVIYGAWNFVAVTVDRSAGTVTFNVNGVADPPLPLSPAGSFSSPLDLLIGGTYATGIGYGELALDEVELFDRAVTSAEFNAIWQADASGKCKPSCTAFISCPANLNVTTCNQAGLMVTYPNPAAASTCGSITNIVCTPPSGSVFPVGVTTVSCTATDNQGNTASCSFTVTVSLSSPTQFLRLFSGATNGPPGVLPGGALDPQFTTGAPLFTTPNPYVPAVIHWLWLPNSSNSKWVGPVPTYANSPGGVYQYTNRFFLCSTNGAQINGRWTADDTASIWLNGAPTGVVLPAGWGFTNWNPVSILSGFVPGWNELVFRVTNYSQSVTGLRTELTGFTCCNKCVQIACPANIVTNTCASGVAVSYPAPSVTSSCAGIVSLTTTPPSGSAFPLGTNVVTCTAIDALGNAASCSFTITVQPLGQPVIVKCPPNQTIYTCNTSAVAYYQANASGQVGPVVCSPPSGSSFPLGTNVVTCIATNACGAVSSCQFLVVVKPYIPTGPPLVYQAGLPDNFVMPTEPSPTNACIVSAFSGYPYWRAFDQTGFDRIFGHRFTGLPNTVVQGQLVVRMKPEDDYGADNDGLFMGLPACAFSNFIFASSIKVLPGAAPPTGGTWKVSSNAPTTFTINLNPALISHINSAQKLDVAVHDDTTVDYMQLRLWKCPPPIVHNGLPHSIPFGTNVPSAIAAIPQPELPGFGTIANGPALSIIPPNGDLTAASSVDVDLGGAGAFTFTTILDMDAPDGARIVISAPTPDGTNTPVITLVKSCRPRCGWDIKPAKLYDDASSLRQISAVDGPGNLLDSFLQTAEQGDLEPPLTLYSSNLMRFPLSVMIDSVTGEIAVMFPGNVTRRLCNGLPCPRGWDGTIKGTAKIGGRKGWDGTIKCPCYDDSASRIVFTPTGGHQPGTCPTLNISSTGLSELIIAGEQLTTMGGHTVRADLVGTDPLASFQSTPAGDGVNWNSSMDDSGVSIDLGQSSSFEAGIHHFENGDIPTQEQLFRIFTNRPGPGPTYPPPPPIELRLAQGVSGVNCTADFTTLGATMITAQLYLGGSLVATGTISGPVMAPEEALTLGAWPERIAASASEGTLRIKSSEPFSIQGVLCDELRLVPGLPGSGPAAPFLGELQCLGSAGSDNLIYDLQRVTACAPTRLDISQTPDGTVLQWTGTGYRLLGAETPLGPWIDLDAGSPIVVPPTAAQRYFRLLCD